MHFSKEQQHTEEDEQESDDISTHYEVVECIAEGSFGKVFRCVSRSEQEECAVKVEAYLPSLLTNSPSAKQKWTVCATKPGY